MSFDARWLRGMRRLGLVGAMAALVLMPGMRDAVACADPPQPELPRSPLHIDTDGGRYAFSVELAETPEQKACGLMLRERLGPGEGMLFSYDPPGPAYMWMANTLIPLDMLFIDADGHVMHIEADARPGDRTARGTDGPVRGVLELPAGTVRRLGIAEGDIVRHALFAR